MFTNLAMRTVHIEAVFGYDTSNFLMVLSRFASLRGWPEMIYSDPGSQLVGAERSSKRLGKESIESRYKEILFRMVPPGYLDLPTVPGIKEQWSL